MRRYIVSIVAVVGFCGMLRIAAAQQHESERRVTAVGTSSVTAQPELLRVTVELSADGKDVKEALGNLNEQKKSAREKLQKLDVAADAVKFANPAMGEAPLTPQQRQMRMMMMRGGKKPTTTKTTISVSSLLTVEIPLKASTPEDLLIAAADLQEKVKGIFKSDAKAATPEEQEVLEEMQNNEEASGQPKPGEPSFLYLHKISEQEQQTAIIEAFAKARASAERLAKAAAAQLGDVRSLSSSASSGNNQPQDMSSIYFAAMTGQKSPEGTVGEATSAQPGPVTSRITVSADFSLK